MAGPRWRTARLTALSVAVLCAAAVPAARADSVYVTNNFGGNVSQYDAGSGGALTAKPQGAVGAGTNPVGIVVSPDGRSVYVANNGSKNVSQYDVGDDGALTAKSPALVAAGTGPFGAAVTPDGKSVYVTNASDGSISQYDVGAGGVLTPKVPATVANGAPLFGIAVSPDGKSVYVATNSGFFGTVSQYDIGANGHLTPKAPATVPAGMNPLGVAVSPDGGSVYLANGGGDNISQYDVGAGGALAAKPQATVAAGQSPFAIAVRRDGTSVYVTNQGANRDLGGDSVSQYDVAPGGGLIAKAPARVPVGETPRGVAMSTNGASVYVPHVNNANVWQFDVASGGALAAKSPTTVAAGSGADGVGVSPFGGGGGGGGGERPPPGPPLVTLLELTEITSGPSGLIAELPKFTFVSPRLGAGATFECRFDGAAFRPCTSPHTGFNLGRGPHTFEVRAIDGGGTPDPTPASRSFTLGRVVIRDSCTINVDWTRFDSVGRPTPLQSCTTPPRQCPTGSLCTLKGAVDMTEEDTSMSFQAAVKMAVQGPNRDLIRDLDNTVAVYCLTHASKTGDAATGGVLKLGCPATTGGVSFFGQDDVVTGQCSVPARFLVAEPKPGPDDARVVTCTTTLTMELAANLGAKPRSGLSIGLLAPGAGTLTVSGTTTGTARAAARRSRPAIRTTRVKARAAGPLKFKLKPTSAAMKTLRRGRPLKLRLRLVFVAADGTRTIKTQALTVKLPVRLPRRPPPPRRP